MRIAICVLLVTLMTMAAPAKSEGACPQGYYQTTPPGPQGPIGCAPMPTTKPAQKWESKWGAIASGGGQFGIVSNMQSKRKAESEALRECRTRGGSNCKIDRTYRDQCAAVAASTSMSSVVNAETEERATKLAMTSCQKDSGNLKCWIYYSGCSLPTRI